MSLLEVQNLSLARGGKTVLSDVSAAFAPGQITAITGPNGAGKSSLLMACAGLLDPAEGQAQLNSRPLSDYPQRMRARSLGYLAQSAEIAWDVTVEAITALGRMPHGDARSPGGRRAIDAALSATDCEALRTRRAHQLSGGERARVLLARVLAGEPQFILADEPLAALDLAHQLSLLTHLKSSAAAGAGVVMVLHDLALAMNHADHVVVLDKGRLAASAAPGDALTGAIIRDVWGVEARWQGTPGAQALIVENQGSLRIRDR